MRPTLLLPTIIALSTPFLLSHLVSAQAIPAACTTCIQTKSIALSPACDGLQNQPPPLSGVMTNQQKQCFCGLASINDAGAWIQPCLGPSSCDAATVAIVLQTYAGLKSKACEGTAPPAAGGSGATPSGPAPAAPAGSAQSKNNAAGSGISSSKVTGVAAMFAATFAALL
ncbi:MAG: hypothetical protein J3R72DRAFT_459661 [Linnemannia gamsii]|nr:MAG: hypothetical protein J3R72DRAFT_459661 [Linnemannia gamsii]